MYKFLLSAIPLVFFSVLIKAQTTTTTQPPVSAFEQAKYPLNVVFKVKNVASLAEFSDTQQLALADFFKQEEESIANAASLTSAATGQLKAQLATKFQALLTAAQLTAYSQKYPNSYLARHDYSKSSLQLKP